MANRFQTGYELTLNQFEENPSFLLKWFWQTDPNHKSELVYAPYTPLSKDHECEGRFCHYTNLLEPIQY